MCVCVYICVGIGTCTCILYFSILCEKPLQTQSGLPVLWSVTLRLLRGEIAVSLHEEHGILILLTATSSNSSNDKSRSSNNNNNKVYW